MELHPTLTLIIGGTGKTGRRVAQRLQERGLAVRIGSRGSETRFDWNDTSTWAPALEGVDAVYVTYSPDLAVPEAPPRIRAFMAMAAERGIERLVLLSGRGEEEAQRCEQITLEANPAWSVVRASWFDQNFHEGFLVDPLRSGTLALPAGDVREPFIDVDDIADVVVACLTQTGHEGAIHEVTGPRLLTFAEAVAEIAAATGREIEYVTVPVDAFVDAMRAQHTPEEIIRVTRFLFETVLDGRNESITDGVQRVLGRPARDFRDYARATAATGVWSAADVAGGAR